MDSLLNLSCFAPSLEGLKINDECRIFDLARNAMTKNYNLGFAPDYETVPVEVSIVFDCQKPLNPLRSNVPVYGNKNCDQCDDEYFGKVTRCLNKNFDFFLERSMYAYGCRSYDMLADRKYIMTQRPVKFHIDTVIDYGLMFGFTSASEWDGTIDKLALETSKDKIDQAVKLGVHSKFSRPFEDFELLARIARVNKEFIKVLDYNVEDVLDWLIGIHSRPIFSDYLKDSKFRFLIDMNDVSHFLDDIRIKFMAHMSPRVATSFCGGLVHHYYSEDAAYSSTSLGSSICLATSVANVFAGHIDSLYFDA